MQTFVYLAKFKRLLVVTSTLPTFRKQTVLRTFVIQLLLIGQLTPIICSRSTAQINYFIDKSATHYNVVKLEILNTFAEKAKKNFGEFV